MIGDNRRLHDDVRAWAAKTFPSGRAGDLQMARVAAALCRMALDRAAEVGEELTDVPRSWLGDVEENLSSEWWSFSGLPRVDVLSIAHSRSRTMHFAFLACEGLSTLLAYMTRSFPRTDAEEQEFFKQVGFTSAAIGCARAMAGNNDDREPMPAVRQRALQLARLARKQILDADRAAKQEKAKNAKAAAVLQRKLDAEKRAAARKARAAKGRAP